MHYCVYAVLPVSAKDDIEGAIEELLAPYQDKEWDWYQIGGRYTGWLDGYDPAKDPNNQEKCDLCNGTGDRNDLKPAKWKKECNGCNGCKGKGVRTKWPTEWATHKGDIQPVGNVDIENKKPYAFVDECGWTARESFKWSRKDKKGKLTVNKEFLDELKASLADHKDGIIVVLDCHN